MRVRAEDTAESAPSALPELPGPGLDLPVDVDGDGLSTWGDVWVLNKWLELGGSLPDLIQQAKANGDVLDCSGFFQSPAAALSKESPLNYGAFGAKTTEASASSGAQAGGAAALGDACTSSGALLDPFFQNGGVGQVSVAYCDGTNATAFFESAAGHAYDLDAGVLFVARNVNGLTSGSTGGVTRVMAFDTVGDGRIPIASTLLGDWVTGLCAARKLALDKTNSNAAKHALLVSILAEAGEACFPVNSTLGTVRRVTGLTSPTGTLCSSEITPGSISNPDGVAVVTAADAAGSGFCLAAGNLVVVNNVPFSDFDVFGSLRRIQSNIGPSGCAISATLTLKLQGLDMPAGAAIGDFGGTGQRAIYFGQRHDVVPGRQMIGRTTGLPFTTFNCSWDAFCAGVCLHTLFGVNLDATRNGQAVSIPVGTFDVVIFDPFSPRLFVTDSVGNIYKVTGTPNGLPIPFATGFNKAAGISFPHSGVMAVSEEGKLTVIDGWRFKFIRGDANASGEVLMDDATFITNFLFVGGSEPTCWDTADVNDDSRMNLSDAVYLLNHLFTGGPAPPAPFPDFGVDQTGDLFGCRSYLAAQNLDP